jgi:hypothetical protein
MERLELATRFRPIHIQMLFVALEPMPRAEDDFYRPPESLDFFDSFLSALNISPDAEGLGGRLETAETKAQTGSNGAAMLFDFQRRGYYLTYLSECPVTAENSASLDPARGSPNQAQLQRPKPTEGGSTSAGLKPGPPGGSENSARGAMDLGIALGATNMGTSSTEGSAASECISRLAPTLIKRIRFNYKPKHVVLLGADLSPLIGVFEQAGLGPLLVLNQGAPLTIAAFGLCLENADRVR